MDNKNIEKLKRGQHIERPGQRITIPEQTRLTSKQDRDNFKKGLKKKRDRDAELVRGIFINHETPNGMAEFALRLYPGDPIVKYQLFDGQMYELPLGVAKHLNQSCSYKVHKYQLGPDGNYTQNVGKRVRRFSFQSLDYTDAIKEEMYEDNTILPKPDTIHG